MPAEHERNFRAGTHAGRGNAAGIACAPSPGMRLQDIMSKDIKTIAPHAELAVARNSMRTNRIRHLIVTAGREVVGIVSDRDLAGRSTGTVADAMTRGVVTATPQTTVRQAANLLRGHIIGCRTTSRPVIPSSLWSPTGQ